MLRTVRNVSLLWVLALAAGGATNANAQGGSCPACGDCTCCNCTECSKSWTGSCKCKGCKVELE